MSTPPKQTVRVIDSALSDIKLDIIEGGGNATVALWPGNGGIFRTFQLVDLLPEGRTIPLSHSTDCVYYVTNGAGRIVDLARGSEADLVEGTMVHIDRGDEYQLFAATDSVLQVIGGPCPPDPALYQFIKRELEPQGT